MTERFTMIEWMDNLFQSGQDGGYIGNVPLSKFDPPPPELLRKLDLGST
ncbi:MAG: hypothetical protein M3O26_06445 [Pseudomonadota bacterium]|nr:hypothetical protein [Pseudomonadota bacterium]